MAESPGLPKGTDGAVTLPAALPLPWEADRKLPPGNVGDGLAPKSLKARSLCGLPPLQRTCTRVVDSRGEEITCDCL